MSLRTDHIAGEALPASEVNDIVTAILQNAHNIFELYLQNYFASLATPFQGLLFDGWSDTSKTNRFASALLSAASVSDTFVVLNDSQTVNTGDVAAGQEIVFPSTGETKTFLSFLLGQLLTSGSFSQSSGVGQPYQDLGGFNTRYGNANAGGGAGSFAQYSNTVPVDAGVSRRVKTTFSIASNMSGGTGNINNGIAEIIIDGNTVGTYTIPNLNSASSNPFDFTYTPSGSTSTIVLKVRFVSAWTNPSGQFTTDWSALTYGETKMNFTSGLANAYSIGAAVGKLVGNMSVDTGGKRLIMSAGSETRGYWYNRRVSFQSSMETVRLWITRNWTARYNPTATIANGATTTTLPVVLAGEFANGDIIDIYTSDNLTRERKTLSGVTGGAVSTAVFDAATASASTTFSHTTSGSNRVLAVWVYSGGTTPVSGITYSGVAMTFVGAANDWGGSGYRIELWKLANPASGANNVIVSGGSPARMTAQSFNAASDITSFVTGGNDTILDVDVTFGTFIASDIGILGFAATLSNGNLTADSGVTNDDTGSFITRVGHLASGRTDAPTLGWTSTGSGFRATAIGAVVKGYLSPAVLTFSPAIIKASGFATSSFVERVDAIPSVGVLASGADDSFVSLTYVRSIVDFTNSEVEDEYSYTTGTPNTQVVEKISFSRNNTTLVPYTKRLGTSLNT